MNRSPEVARSTRREPFIRSIYGRPLEMNNKAAQAAQRLDAQMTPQQRQDLSLAARLIRSNQRSFFSATLIRSANGDSVFPEEVSIARRKAQVSLASEER